MTPPSGRIKAQSASYRVPCKTSDEMLWEGQLPWYQQAVLWCLQLGSIPQHVAVMPDGSRRFAKRTGTDLHRAYVSGTRLYERMCRWCLGTGVQRMTAFFMAARQLQRSTFEKAALLSGVVDTWMESLQNLSEVTTLGIELRTVGALEMLPTEFAQRLAALEIATSGGFSDITAELIEGCLDLVECPEVSMLFRCAGPRFSDFVVPQCSYAYLHMESKTWEDIRMRDWIWAVLFYQLQWPAINVNPSRSS
ncbi:dehydrodolichyl diphosphate synthase complex subunit DHDDS-like [Amblyomma americanum]